MKNIDPITQTEDLMRQLSAQRQRTDEVLTSWLRLLKCMHYDRTTRSYVISQVDLDFARIRLGGA